MNLRVWLRLARAEGELPSAGVPDAVIVPAACCDRSALSTVLRQRPRTLLFVEIAPPSDQNVHDLDRVIALAPDGVLVRGCAGVRDVEQLSARLAVCEAELGLPDGKTRIVAAAGDTAAAALSLPMLAQRPPARLAGLAFDPGRLAAALRCDEEAAAVAHVMASTLLAAASAGVPALVMAPAGASEARFAAARREGFRGAIVSDPAQIAAARRVFG